MPTLVQPGFLEMPRMKYGFIVTALLALVTGTAVASDWQPVGSNENVSFSMDVASLVRDGPIVRAWVREVYTSPKSFDVGIAMATLSRTYFDCAKRRSAIKKATWYLDEGFKNVVRSSPETSDALLEWVDVPPDTFDEGLLDFACSKAPK